MSNGYPTRLPTPDEIYSILPYQFPRIDLQPVVRIPVVGPKKYNTLVVVRGQVFTTAYRVANGTLTKQKVVAPTNFRLAGFDPRITPEFEHSTTAVVHMIQTMEESPFISAVDEVGGFFDDQGRWVIVANVADLWEDTYAASTAYVSSWVLCTEPPLPEGTDGGSIVSKYAVPAGQWVLEWNSAAVSDTDRQFERFLKINQRRKAREMERRQSKSKVKTDAPGITLSAPVADSVPIVFPLTSLSNDE